MVKVLLNEQAEDFRKSYKVRVFEPESEDGMRREGTVEVRKMIEYHFSNELRSEEGFFYDLEVIGLSDMRRVLVTTEGEFAHHFGEIWSDLRGRGLELLSHPACVRVKSAFYDSLQDARRVNGDSSLTSKAGDEAGLDSAENIVELDFGGEICLLSKELVVMTYDQLLDYVTETDKGVMLAQALHDGKLCDWAFSVAFDSIPEELRGKKQYLPVRRRSLEEVLQTGAVTEEDVRRAMLRCQQNSANLEIFRKYCPERIIWGDVDGKDLCESDLDLMALSVQTAAAQALGGKGSYWSFLDRCMAKPELERKVVENAFRLAHDDLMFVAERLRTMTCVELFRSAFRYAEQYPRWDNGRYLSPLFGLAYDGLERSDYELCWSVVKKLAEYDGTELNGLVAFMLKVGCLAGVSEDELTTMLLDGREFFGAQRLDLTADVLREIYREFDFAPGISWAQEADRQKAAEERKAAEKQRSATDALVQYVRRSKATAVPIRHIREWELDGAKEVVVSDCDGAEIGLLELNGSRLCFLQGTVFDYLIDVERAKSPRNGVLHIDVWKLDINMVIGQKGGNLKKAAERLRELGCKVAKIQAHSHEARPIA